MTEEDDVPFGEIAVARLLSPEAYDAQREKEDGPAPKINGNGLPPARSLPHSIEGEESLLALCLFVDDDGKILRQCVDAGISRSSFFNASHGIIFGQLAAMLEQKQPVAVGPLAEELKKSGHLDAVGGYAFLVQITSRATTSLQTGYFIRLVVDMSLRRDLIWRSTHAIELAHNTQLNLEEAAQPIIGFNPVPANRNKGLTVWRPADFRAWTPPMELNLLGAGYLRRRQITTLIGPPGVGKSRLSLWLGVCHIMGRSCAGLEPKGGKLRWLFIGNENDPERQKGDLDSFYRNMTVAEQKEVDDRLFLHVLDSHDDSQLALADPDAYRRIGATLKAVKPDVFVCDPWGNMIEGSESDDLVIRQTLKLLLRAVAENSPNSAILIIHHARTGKANTIEAGNNYSGGSLGRGSKVLVSQARCELALWFGDSEDASQLVLTCEKANNAPKFDPIGLKFENGIYSVDSSFSVKAWRDDIDGKRSSKTLTINDVVKCVQTGVFRYKDICERHSDVDESTVKRRLRDAVEKGYLRKTEPTGSYELVNSPQKDKPRNFTEPNYPDEDNPFNL